MVGSSSSPRRPSPAHPFHFTTVLPHLTSPGETEWTISGQQTGKTDIPLTSKGESQVLSTVTALIGKGKLLDPSSVAQVFVSPRVRARRTFELLFADDCVSALTADESHTIAKAGALVTVTEQIAEWDYGDYEGRLIADVRKERREKGLDEKREWDVWNDGSEGGESAAQVTERLDGMVQRVKEVQRPLMKDAERSDVVLVRTDMPLVEKELT